MARPFRLPRAFPSRDGVPSIARVDRRIFTLRYFTHCLQCGFCHDWCCQFGVDVELERARAILRHADELESYVGISRDRWFEPEVEQDPELPGGGALRTRVEGGHCVFLRREGRGCTIHAFCLERGLDYHALKSIVDCLFPLTFSDGLLCPADEIVDGELVCAGLGPTLYRGVREELRHYFGDECVAALDALEAKVVPACA
jgi:hypothetical protein